MSSGFSGGGCFRVNGGFAQSFILELPLSIAAAGLASDEMPSCRVAETDDDMATYIDGIIFSKSWLWDLIASLMLDQRCQRVAK